MKNLSKKLLIFSLSIVMSLPLAAFLGDTRLAKAANSAPVMIDEVMPNPSSGNEWVELFNQTNSTIDLSGWTLTELSSPDSNPKENLLQTLVGQIPARGLVTFDIHSAKLNNDGDSIGLYQGTMSMGTLIDRVSYGSVATPYNQSTVAAAPVQGETIAYQFETGNWLTNSSPSKNWFNDSLLNFTSIASDLSSQGISTNLASFPDPSNVSGLYFLSAGKSEIIFDQTPLNLNNLDLFCNLVGVIGLNSGQVVISNKNEIMSQIGASIYMYNLDFADGTLPVILIDGRLAKAGEILSENYSGGTLNFVVPKINFSTLDLDLGDGNTVPVNLIEADQSEVLIQNLAYNITSPNGFSYPLLGDQKSGYRIFTDRQPNNVYKIQFAGSTSEKTFDTLDGDYFGLYVTESNVDAATLNNYFAARADLTQSFKDYYRDVVAGKQPLLYLYQQVDGQVKLADAASRDILGRNVDFFINADFPISKINLFGHVEADSQNYAVNFNLTIHGVDQNKPTVTLKITDGNGITDQINQTLSIGGIDESGIVSMRFSNDEINYSTWENFAPSKNWQISDGFGRKSIYLQLEDSFGNISDPIIARTIFRTPEQLSLDSDLTLTATSQEVLVGNNFNNNSVVNVPLGIQNGILNFWPTMDTLGVATVPGNIEINSATSDGNITLELPKGTKISGPTGWSGDINLPQIVSISNLEVVGDAGFFPTIKNSFTVGLSDSSLIFDHALRLKLSGLGQQSVGYYKDGKFVPIKERCSADTQEVADLLASGGDCKISVDTNSDGVAEDLVVWTKHLTQFVTYSQTKVANPTFSTLKLLKSDGQYLAINWQGTGAEKYLIKINDGIYETVLGNSSDIGTTYHLEYKILNNGSYTILVTAKIGQVESIGQMAQTAIFTAESLTVETGNDNLPNPITPSTAKAAEPSVSMPVIPDANGQIKGVETTPAGDQIDWSPWIVLFIIILLAGLATAGYTYWNTGKEEGELEGAVAIEKKREEDQEEGRKSRLKQENGQKSKAKDQNIKNNKRW